MRGRDWRPAERCWQGHMAGPCISVAPLAGWLSEAAQPITASSTAALQQQQAEPTFGVAVAVRARKGTSGSASRSLYRWRYCEAQPGGGGGGTVGGRKRGVAAALLFAQQPAEQQSDDQEGRCPRQGSAVSRLAAPHLLRQNTIPTPHPPTSVLKSKPHSEMQ